MHKDYAGEKLCIFISKNDKYEGIVLYELLLEIAFNSHLSGGTVTIGDKGFFGAQDESTRQKILRSSENLPVVLEFQGRIKRIDRFVERIQPMIKEGLFTRTDVWITKFNSADESTTDFQDQENEDQSQIFNEDIERADIPDQNTPNLEFAVGEDEGETISPDRKSKGEELNESKFLEPDQEQATVEDEVEIKIPLFDDEDDDSRPTPESLDTDPENILEDDKKGVPAPAVEDEPEIPSFHSVDDDHIQTDAGNDAPKSESDSFIEEEDDEDEPVYQLTDFSESQAEESGEEKFEMDDPQETAGDTSNGSEFSESQTEEDIDKLFDESNEKFENTFDDKLKEAVGASVSDTDIDSAGKTTLDKEPDDSSGDEEGENARKDPKTDDKNHKEEDMINYFSELFKK